VDCGEDDDDDDDDDDSLFSSWTETLVEPMSCDDICLIWVPKPLILLPPDADVFDLALAFDVSISFA